MNGVLIDDKRVYVDLYVPKDKKSKRERTAHTTLFELAARNPSRKSTGCIKSTAGVEVAVAVAGDHQEGHLAPVREGEDRTKASPPLRPVAEDPGVVAGTEWCSSRLTVTSGRGSGVAIDGSFIEIEGTIDETIIREDPRGTGMMKIGGDRGREVRVIGIDRGTTEIGIEIGIGIEGTVAVAVAGFGIEITVIGGSVLVLNRRS
jgi:hypothetical protein